MSVQSKSGDGFLEIASRAVVRSGKPDSVRKVPDLESCGITNGSRPFDAEKGVINKCANETT